MNLSFVIITLNEEKNIGRCLESIKDVADDIVVIDSFSTDKTEQICRQYAVNFIQRGWEGYSATKNFGNSIAKYDWVFSIDADESLSDELRTSILNAKRSNTHEFYKIKRLTNYCGSWIRHTGWYPDVKVRIFDKRKASWEGDIHENIIGQLPVPIIILEGDLLHYSYYTIDDHVKQISKFTDIAAKSLAIKGEKSRLFKLIFAPIIKFLRDYILKLGFLDGFAGFQISILSSYATYLKYAKLRELQIKGN